MQLQITETVNNPVSLIVSLVLAVLSLVAEWRIFTKAGRAGWKCLIPIYNAITELGFTWKKSKIWSLVVAALLAGVGSAILEQGGDDILNMVGLLLAGVGAIAIMVFTIRSNYYLARSFGHGVPFTIGLLLASPLFRLILGLGGSEYAGNGSRLAKRGE